MAKVVRMRNKLFELIRQKELAEGRRITNKEVARELGVSVNTLKNWIEQNVNQFNGDILINARHYFGVQSVNEIMDFEEAEVTE